MKLISLFHTWICLCGLLALINTQVSFTVTSSAASPNAARSTSSQYSILLTAVTTFSTNFDVSVTFPTGFSLSTLTGCQLSVNGVNKTAAVCTLTSSSNLVAFSSINNVATINNLTLIFSTNTAMYAGSFYVSLSYYLPSTPSTTYGSNSALINIVSATMGCSFTSSSAVVGATSNFQLSYYPSSFVSAGSILQVQFSPWSAYNLTNFPNFAASTVCGSACTIRSPNQAQGFYNQILTYSYLYPSSSTSNMSLSINNGRNPASTQPVSITVTLLYFVSASSQISYMTCSTTFAPTTPNQFSGISFSPLTQTISDTNPITLVLNLTNPISSISYLSVTYSSDISVSFNYITSNQASIPKIYPIVGNSNGFLLGGLTSSTTIFSTLFLVQFSFTNAPYGNYPVSVVFQTINSPANSNSSYNVDTVTLTYTFTPSTISSGVVSAANTSIGVTTNMSLSFTTQNALIANSKIIVTLPVEITSTVSSTCLLPNLSSTCTLYNGTSFLININTAVVLKGTTITITMNNVINPATTTSTSSFTLTTYYYNTSTPTDILSSGATFTATPVNLYSASVTPTSLTVAASTTYTINFQNTNPLPAGSYVIVTFPSQFVNSVGAALTSFSISNNIQNGCTMTILSTMQFQFTSCITSTAPSQSTFSIKLANIINPSSTKPTSSLIIKTFYNSLQMQNMTSGLGVTLTTSTALLASSIAVSNANVNALATYTFTLNFSQTYTSGSRIILTFPSLISYTLGYACTSGTSGVTVSCYQSTSSVLLVIMNGAGTLPSSIIWSITNIQNAWYSLTSTFTFDTTTSDTTYYYMEKGTAAVTMQPITLTPTYTPNNQLVLLAASILNINIANSFVVTPTNASLLKLTITLPSDLTLTNSTCTTSITGAVCSSGTGNQITVSQLDNFSSSINVTFSGLAGYFITSSSFNIALSYNGLLIASNSVFKVSSYCQSPCQGCNGQAQCTSCLPSLYTTLNYYYSVNNSCLAACPATYFIPFNSSTCLSCNASACLNCITTANTCTSCSNPFYLSGNTCVAVCPNTFYGTNNTCVTCINQCYNCTNATYCQSCVSSYSLNPDHTCLTTCPTGYASVSSVCTLCTNNCLTCSMSTSNCTSCGDPYFLSGSTCVQTCPNTFFGNNNLCVSCINQCQNCTSATYCLSCIASYSLNPNHTCLLTCPTGYVSVSSVCTLCTSNCLTCISTTNNCTSCVNNYYLSGSNCVQTCPNTYYGNNNNSLCVSCINQCYNCTSATYCLSCVNSYSLNPNQTCALTCPTGYASMSSICTLCTSNCLTCSTTTSTCTSCVNNYFLSGTNCVQTCPNTFYGNNNNSLCVSCINQCNNCTSATYCLSCINSFSLNPDHTCLTTCPSGYVSVSSVCTQCTSNCVTCSGTPSSCTSCANPYFLSGSSCIQTCPNTYYGNGTLCVVCLNQCYNCTSSTYCLSCITSYSLNPDHTCQITCPSGYVSVSSVCTVCTSSCLTCSNTPSNCTSCANPYYLSGNACLQTCPNTYYGNNNLCVVCINQCYNCTNSTYCLSCVSGYSLNPDHTCQLNCPSGYVSVTSVCSACTSYCLTCSLSTSNCTSCGSGFILYNNSCIFACPLGQYQDTNKQCQNCISPCKYCLTALQCISCVTSYTLYNGSQCLSTCPAGTFAYIATCQACSSTCQTCENAATNCTSCYLNTYFYLNKCYTTCPSPTYPYQGKCTICVQPCSTCLNSALLCSSCVSGYLLLNTSCVLSCPSTGYIEVNGSCLSCPTNCISCQSSIVCKTCGSGFYLYQGGCVTACPSTSPIVVSQTCNSCNSQCATCSGSPDSCLTCTLYYFKYSYTCVASCPISYYSNIMTYTCQSGLSSKIVFFPVLITYFIIVIITIIFKVINHSTSFPTVITSLSGWLEIIISAYLLSLMSQTYLQVGLNYAFPQALIAISFIFTAAINVVHFKVNYQRLAEDEYVRKWQNINVNYTYFLIFRYASLFTHCKLFRMIYSKLFGSIHLSLIAYKFRNVFTISTVITVAFLFLTEVPLLISAFYLAYNKLLKDQIFYTSVECLLIVIFSIIISLIDIHKPEDYFEDTEFMTTKRYLQKVNNDSLNKLQDEYRDKEEGSLDGEKHVGTSGGKFVFSRRDPHSMNQILLEEGSAATDAFETMAKPNKLLFQEEKSHNQDPFKSEISPRSIKSKASSRKQMYPKSQINIFEPIQQEEAQYYELLKYDEQDFKTAAKIEKENGENESQQEGQLQIQRKQQFGTNEHAVDNSDNRSLLEYRQRKQQWNQIIQHRQKLAHQIFNTVDTKQLYKQLEKIEEPINEDQYDEQQREINTNIKQRRVVANNHYRARDLPIQRQLPIEEANVEREKEKRRRRKKGKRGNKELEEIYLQRLAEKVDPKKKTIYASSKSFKYEF